MHPVFLIGLCVAGILLWLLLSFLYKPIGWVGERVISDAKNAITEDKKPKRKKRIKKEKK